MCLFFSNFQSHDSCVTRVRRCKRIAVQVTSFLPSSSLPLLINLHSNRFQRFFGSRSRISIPEQRIAGIHVRFTSPRWQIAGHLRYNRQNTIERKRCVYVCKKFEAKWSLEYLRDEVASHLKSLPLFSLAYMDLNLHKDPQYEEWGTRYYFTYYSQLGNRGGISSMVEVVVLAISFVLAVGGNSAMASCILRYKELRTPTNMCLVNLAVADLLFTVGVPAVAYTRFTQSWHLGETICKVLPYTQFVCGFVLLWTLTFISMDRHRCLAVAPFRSALTKSRVFTTSLLTWIVAALIFLPIVFWFKQKEIAHDSTICTLIFPRSKIVNVSLCYTIPIVVLACLLPMALLVYHYQRIFQKILDTRSTWAVPCVAQHIQGLENSNGGGHSATGRRDSELSVVGTLLPWAGRKLSGASLTGQKGRAGSLSQHEEIRLYKHLRVVRIVLLNVVAVLVMWLPITIVMLLICIDGKRPTEDTNFFLRSHHFVWTLIVAELNTIVNPLLYGVLSENFRVVCFAKLWKQRRLDSSSKSAEHAALNKSSKSLQAFQNRLGRIRAPNPKPQEKYSNCSIVGSIVEVPQSEKL